MELWAEIYELNVRLYQELKADMRKIIGCVVLFFMLLTGTAGAQQTATVQEESVSLEIMIGQMLMVGFRGEGATTSHAILRDITKYRIGGVILFEKDALRPQAVRNIVSGDQVRELINALQECSDIPLFVAVDQEGGFVSRFKPAHGFSGTKSPQRLGGMPVNKTYEAGELTGKFLASVGINMNFAPVLDVNVDPESPAIGRLERSFSDDPEKVSAYGHAFAQGMGRYGIIAGYKHFPGHGSAKGDSHKGLPDVTDTWSVTELLPFADVIGKEPAHIMMIGHLYNRKIDSENPSSLSYGFITNILREQLLYKGVVVTDDLQMEAITNEYTLEEAAVKAVAAGADILLVGNNLAYSPDVVQDIVNSLVWAVQTERLSEERIKQSYERIIELKKQSGVFVEGVQKQ